MDDSSSREWERDALTFLDEPIPDEVLQRGVLTVADVLSATVAGSGIESVERVGQEGDFADGPSSILGTERQTEAGQAALVNGAASIAQEIEEGHNSGGHVGASIVVGGFALAEKYDADGRTFLEACIRSYEICARLEYAIFAMKERLNEAAPWLLRNPHSTWTTIGPALTGAQCMDLDADELRETFRIAANLAVISMHDPYEEGAPSRNFTAGFSAQAGVNAALTSAAGLEGSASAIERVYDPLREMKGEAFDRSFAELGNVWEITRNYFKLAPSCRYTHPPLDALREVIDDVDRDDIERIDVFSYRNAVDLDHRDVPTLTSGKFSIPYVLARYISTGDIWLDDFDDESLTDESVRALAEKVTLHHEPKYDESFPDHWSARVEVTHTDGRTVVGECVDPPGDYRRHPDRERLEGKFRDLLAWRLGDDKGEAALEAVLDLSNRDVRSVGSALRGE